jgi:hypothetical protein
MFRNANNMEGPFNDANVSKLRQSHVRTYATRTEAKHGVNERPRCVTCKLMMRLTRREAHPEHGPRYELQTFACRRCGHTEQARVASPGAIA